MEIISICAESDGIKCRDEEFGSNARMSSIRRENHHCFSLLDELPCPLANDCEVGNWGDWSVCSEGKYPKKNRTREIKRNAKNGGKQCCQHGMLSNTVKPCKSSEIWFNITYKKVVKITAEKIAD